MLTQINELRGAIGALVKEKNCGPIIVRLAWHDAGTFCAKTKTGGARACMRFSEGGEAKFGANAGLQIAISLLEPIRKKYVEPMKMSIADFWALAAVEAIKAMGGPVVTFRQGRVDSKKFTESVEEGRHPDGAKGAQHLREVFNRMGFDNREIVVLSGAHTIGQCHVDRSGFEGPWTSDKNKFDNTYYVDLLNKKWIPSKSSKGNDQFKDEATGKFMMLPSDLALIKDEKFRPFVEKYAKDQEAFFNDFKIAFQKLIELGYSKLQAC